MGSSWAEKDHGDHHPTIGLANGRGCRGRSNFGAPGRRGSEVLRADLKPSQIKHKLRCGRGFSCGMPSASDRRSAPDFLRPLLQNYSALFTRSWFMQRTNIGARLSTSEVSVRALSAQVMSSTLRRAAASPVPCLLMCDWNNGGEVHQTSGCGDPPRHRPEARADPEEWRWRASRQRFVMLAGGWASKAGKQHQHTVAPELDDAHAAHRALDAPRGLTAHLLACRALHLRFLGE